MSLSLLRVLLFASPAVISLVTRVASAESAASGAGGEARPQRLGLSAATGYLGSAAGSGIALSSGVRLALGTHAALSADVGYGVLSSPHATQDRWWVLPAIAWVIPAEAVRFDVGAGLGLGASSGYASFAEYARGPFSPRWAFQLVPAARAHISAARTLRHDVDFFVRVQAAALLLSGTQLGFRNGNPHAGPADTTWIDLGAGVQFRLL